MWWNKKKITKEEAEKEIDEMVKCYKKRWSHWKCGFLVGSSICGNSDFKNCDSGRFWYLRNIIDNQ